MTLPKGARSQAFALGVTADLQPGTQLTRVAQKGYLFWGRCWSRGHSWGESNRTSLPEGQELSQPKVLRQSWRKAGRGPLHVWAGHRSPSG